MLLRRRHRGHIHHKAHTSAGGSGNGRAHGIKVVLLKQANVAHHVVFGHHMTQLRVVLVAVYTADQQRFTV